MTDGILDLTVMVIVLAVVVAIAMGLIVPLVSQTYEDSRQMNYDKTVYKSLGETVISYGSYDGTMSKLEVILATQVMDWGMPEPRKIRVEDTDIEITSTYRTELMQYAGMIWNKIGADPGTTKYNYVYDIGNPSTDMDDAYTIKRK